MKRHRNVFVTLFVAATFICTALSSHGATEEGRVTTDVWSGYWWPSSKGEILEPLGKYDVLAGRRSAPWERAKNPSNLNYPGWFGLCHGWAASSVMEPEPKKTVVFENRHLTVGDQKGLLAVCHDDDVANFYGDRFGDGVGNEDSQDIAPDELWMVLRRHIKEQGVPIVLDIEPGPEVWNYPAFAYRIDYSPIRAGSPIHQGTLSIWFADDAVHKDFVGLKRVFQRYSFQVEMRGDSVVMGTGKWIGESTKNHPDFAWFPYVVRSSNPELDYDFVRKLLGRSSTPPPPTSETMPVLAPVDVPSDPETESYLTLSQLLPLLEGKISDFVFDISVEPFGGKFTENELLKINGISRATGHLYLFGIAPDGRLSVLYPQPEDDNRIEADKQFTVPNPNASYQWRLTKPYGNYRVKGIVTEKPLRFTGEFAIKPQTAEFATKKRILDWGELLMRVIPAEQDVLIKSTEKVKGKPNPESSLLRRILGRFSQDEEVIYVGPAK